MSIQKRIKLIFDKMILEDIDAIKNYKYFENEKLLVLYIDVSDIDNEKYFEFDTADDSEIRNLYREIYYDNYFEYDENGNLSTPEFSSYHFYENNYCWYETSEGDFIIKISNYVSKCLRIVGLEDLKISTYINCDK